MRDGRIRGPSMKRISVMLIVSLLLGGVTTVGVAWLCGALLRLREGPSDYAFGLTIRARSGWFLRACRRPGAQSVIGYPVEQLMDQSPAGDWRNHLLAADEIDWPVAFVDPIEPDPRFIRKKVVNVRGWPIPALWCELLTGWLRRDRAT